MARRAIEFGKDFFERAYRGNVTGELFSGSTVGKSVGESIGTTRTAISQDSGRAEEIVLFN